MTGYRLANAVLLSRSPVCCSAEEASKAADLTAEEEAYLASAEVMQSPMPSSLFFIARARTQFILRRPDLALQSLQRVNRSAFAGFAENSSDMFLQAMAHLALIRKSAKGDASSPRPTVSPTLSLAAASAPSPSVPFDVDAAWATVHAAQTQIGVWSAVCPANFAPMEAVVQAEVAFTRWAQQWEPLLPPSPTQLDADIARISQLYQHALELISHDTGRRTPRLGKGRVDDSSAGGSERPPLRPSNPPSPLHINPWLRAIAAECFADFLYTAGCDTEFRRALSDCLHLYLEYDAHVKVQQLYFEWRELLTGQERLWSFLHLQEEARRARPRVTTTQSLLSSAAPIAETPTEGHSSSAFPFTTSGSAALSSSALSFSQSSSRSSSTSTTSSISPHALITSSSSASPPLPTSASAAAAAGGLPSPPAEAGGLSYLENDLLGDNQFDPADASRSSFHYFSLPSSASPSSASSSFPSTHFTDFDLRTVIKATQMLSKEVQLSKLLTALLQILLRSSGAERAILFTRKRVGEAEGGEKRRERGAESKEGPEADEAQAALDESGQQWQIEAFSSIDSAFTYIGPQASVGQANADADANADSASERSGADLLRSASAGPLFPSTVTNYVLHSEQPLLLLNASEDKVFSRDPYIAHHGVKSVMCIPLLLREQLVSVLYLDNATSSGVFSRERLLVSRLIVQQASISIDNARLYERLASHASTLEQAVQLRTRQLEEATRIATEANAAKSSFLSNMSHEIRTPMNGIIAAADLLADPSSSDPLTNEQQELMSIIRVSGDAMLTIINDILDLARIEAGRVEVTLTPFPIRDCIESAVDVVAAKAYSKGLEVQYRVAGDVPYLIRSDSKRLTQILFNLLSNSTKFTSQGDITVEVRAESSAALASGDPLGFDRAYVIHFAVRDTGIGIAKAVQHRLFKPFSQVHADAARNSGGNTGGTGLGLVISKHYVELMGGRVWLDSEVGQGSTFHFTVACLGSNKDRPAWLQQRIDPPKLLSSEDNPLPHAHFKKRMSRVLIVHPLPHTRDLIVETMAGWGIGAMVATTVEEAEEVLAFKPPHDLYAVLVDHRSVSSTEQVDSNDATPRLPSSSPLSQSSRSSSPTSSFDSDLDDPTEVHPPTTFHPGVRATGKVESSSDALKRVLGLPMTRLVTRFTPSLELFERLAHSVDQHRQVKQLSTGKVDPSPLPVIVLAPLQQQRRIRSLMRLTQRNAVAENGETETSRGFVTTPVKAQALYAVLSQAAKGQLKLQPGMTPLQTNSSISGLDTSPTQLQQSSAPRTPNSTASSGDESDREKPRRKQPLLSSTNQLLQSMSPGPSSRTLASAASPSTSASSAAAASSASSSSSSSSARAPSTSAAAAPLSQSVSSILIVEDNFVNQKILRQMLSRLGFDPAHLTVATDGQQGVDAAHAYIQQAIEQRLQSNHSSSSSSSLPSSVSSTRPCYVILMDVLMPVMDGLEATRTIRASAIIPPHYQPYIIALTANAMQGDKQMCLDAGMNAYLSKPVTIATLKAALEEAARRK